MRIPTRAPDELDCLRRKQVADKLNTSIRNLERLAVAGGGPPFVKIGRSVLYPVAELQDWLRSRMTASTSAATVNRK